ncbi:MAG: hypothetical protein V3S51_05430 [Dehalococcoidia bacterium]
MKFLTFSMYDVAKTADVAAASDKVAGTPGLEILSGYVCMGIPFPGFPENKLLSVSVVNIESSEAMAAAAYPLSLAGATVWHVPVLDMAVGGSGEEEKKYRG